jgi:hypothetical protein
MSRWCSLFRRSELERWLTGVTRVFILSVVLDDWDEEDLAMLHALGRHRQAHRIDEFMAQGARCGWCACPIRLRGYVLDGDRRVVFSSQGFPDNVVLKACGSRSELRCPACATLYRGDARHLVRAGLEGGKGVDESIAGHPAVFLTLTAPGFGPVHRETSSTNSCHPSDHVTRCPHGRPLTCNRRHTHDDEAVGTPLCPRCYDYPGAVLHTAYSTELWRRSTIYIARQLAVDLGLSRAECAQVLRLEHCKAAEFQHRGLVHFHAVVRANAPDGSAPPINVGALATAIHVALRAVEIVHCRGTVRWGREIDVQLLDRDTRATRVGTYIAKYATKEPAMHPALLGRILCEHDLKRRDLPPHLFNMAATAWRLGGVDELQTLGLRRHAHHLGYSGHFLTKSRRYSTTFGALRDARSEWQRQRNGTRAERDETTTKMRAVGRGWANHGEELFAAAQARQSAEAKKEAAFVWHTRSG